MTRLGRKFGNAVGEIYNVDPNLISIRLQDGDFIGPKIYEYDDGKYHLLPNENPLEYTQKGIEIILEKGWNIRRKYEGTEELADQIWAAGKILKPLELIFDGDRLYPKDGHRRHFASVLLRKRSPSCNLAEIPATIQSAKSVNLRNIEVEMLVAGDSLPLSPIEIAQYLERILIEDRRAGIKEEDSINNFLTLTGWTRKKYDQFRSLSAIPLHIAQAIADNQIAVTTVLQTYGEKCLSIQEATRVLETAIESAKANGKSKASGSLVQEIREELIEAKEKIVTPTIPFANAKDIPDLTNTQSDNLSDTNSEQPKPKSLKSKARIKTIKQTIFNLVNNADAHVLTDSVTLTIPLEDWEKLQEIYAQIPIPKSANSKVE